MNKLDFFRMMRVELFVEFFNVVKESVVVGGISGKLMMIGMIGWILYMFGFLLIIVNGVVMKNFV